MRECAALSKSPYLILYTYMHADVEVIVKFAEFEYKYGDPSHGQTLLESVIANYPKRLDVWSRYFDLLIKQGSKDAIRSGRQL